MPRRCRMRSKRRDRTQVAPHAQPSGLWCACRPIGKPRKRSHRWGPRRFADGVVAQQVNGIARWSTASADAGGTREACGCRGLSRAVRARTAPHRLRGAPCGQARDSIRRRATRRAGAWSRNETTGERIRRRALLGDPPERPDSAWPILAARLCGGGKTQPIWVVTASLSTASHSGGRYAFSLPDPGFCCGRSGIRTLDLWLRRPTLYPAELTARLRAGFWRLASAFM